MLRSFALTLAAMIVPQTAMSEEMPPPDEPVRVAVVGLSHDHVFWLLHRDRARGDIEIVAAYDRDPRLAEARLADAGLGDVPVYEDLGRLLAESLPEAACLFGSIRDHRPHALACVAAGVHVMVEKPLALNHAEASAMARAADEASVHLLTNYETTWCPSVHALQARLHGDTSTGPVRRMAFRFGHPGPIEIGCREPFLAWLLDPAENGGGAITDFGCYGANLAVWLMRGERPTAVSAVTRTLKPDRYPHVEDDATITIEFAAATAVVAASWNWPAGVKETRVFTRDADLLASDGATLTVEGGESAPAPVDELPMLAPDDSDPFAHLAAVVRGRVAPNALSSVENNLVVMRVLDAARESARTGRRVTLAW